jgi:hypothetical protein
MALLTFQTNAHAHPMICSTPPPESGFTKKCEAINTSGYMSENYPVFYALAPFLGWVGLLAFIGAMVFGLLVLIKNRARKIAC